MKCSRAFLASALVLSLAGASLGRDGVESDLLDVATLEKNLEEIKRREHSVERLLDGSRSEKDALRMRIAARGRAYYKLTRGLPLGDFFEHVRFVEKVRRALLTDLSRSEALEREAKKAERRLSLLRDRRIPLELEQKAAGQARDAILAQEERERAFALAFSGAGRSSDHTAVYSASVPSGWGGDSIAALRGQLPFPVPGRAELQVVRKEFAPGPGLIVRAALGTPARSVFAGRVAFADRYEGYGSTVLIDHGDGYVTVSAGLERIEVRVGDELPAGARIGLLGSSAGRAELYFEIRRGPEVLPPGQWFGI